MMVITETTGPIRITQRNRLGAGCLATGAWWLSMGLVGIVVFVGIILILLALRAASGQGAP